MAYGHLRLGVSLVNLGEAIDGLGSATGFVPKASQRIDSALV